MSGLSYEAEVLIRRPPAEVFDFCSDLRHEAEWNPAARRIEKLTPGPVRAGTRFEAKWANAPPAVVEVTSRDRPMAWATRSRAMGLDVTTEGSLEPVPAGTLYRLRLRVGGRGVARLWAPLALLAMRRREPDNMRRIKLALEGGWTASTRATSGG